jgi:hypothetical protein
MKKSELNVMSSKQLHELARANKLTGHSQLNKEALIDSLVKHSRRQEKQGSGVRIGNLKIGPSTKGWAADREAKKQFLKEHNPEITANAANRRKQAENASDTKRLANNDPLILRREYNASLAEIKSLRSQLADTYAADQKEITSLEAKLEKAECDKEDLQKAFNQCLLDKQNVMSQLENIAVNEIGNDNVNENVNANGNAYKNPFNTNTNPFNTENANENQYGNGNSNSYNAYNPLHSANVNVNVNGNENENENENGNGLPFYKSTVDLGKPYKNGSGKKSKSTPRSKKAKSTKK